jgi:hypothetical protein
MAIQRDAHDRFRAGRKIELDGGSISAEFLQDLCTAAWRNGEHLPLRVRCGTIDGDLVFDHVNSNAAVDLYQVTLGKLSLRSAKLNNLVMKGCEVERIEAGGLETTGPVNLNDGFRSLGRVRLVAASIGADLNCDGATFGRSEDDREQGRSALILDSARVAQNVRLNGASADGWVSAQRVHVGGAFSCRDATLANNQGGALNLRYADVAQGGDFFRCSTTGVVDLRDAKFGGGISLTRASIAGDLRMQNCQADGALMLQCVVVRQWAPDPDDPHKRHAKPSSGSLLVRHGHLGALRMTGSAAVAGELDATGAVVDGDFVLKCVTLGGPHLDLAGIMVAKSLSVHGIEPAGEGPITIRLLNVSADELDDGPDSWPERKERDWPERKRWPRRKREERYIDKHYVDGLAVATVREAHVKWRVSWLTRNRIWSPQPWHELSAALRRRGLEDEARVLAIKGETERTRRSHLRWWIKPWRCVLHLGIGYGHKPMWAFGWAFAIVGVCAWLFTYATLREGANAPEAATILYSLDAFVPVDLGYFSKWTPTEAWWSALAVAEAASGWLLAALLLGAVTGLLKKD